MSELVKIVGIEGMCLSCGQRGRSPRQINAKAKFGRGTETFYLCEDCDAVYTTMREKVDEGEARRWLSARARKLATKLTDAADKVFAPPDPE